MLKKIAAVTLVAASLVWGEARPSKSAPTTKPSTQPVAAKPTTQPSTQPVARKFPTPAELARQMIEKRDTKAKQLQVAFFDLTGAFREKPADFSWFGGEAPTMRELIDRLEQARDDESVKAALLYVGSGTGLNLAQAQEVRDTLVELRRAGKRTFVYADSYDTTSYVLASAATNVCLLEGGEVFVPGIGFEAMFYKGTLDKIGVVADYVQIGEYKGAEEPYTRSAPSEELNGEMEKLVESYYKQIVEGVSLHRSIATEKVRRVIDQAILSGPQAKEAGWVDHLVDSDGLRALMKDELGDDINILHNYGGEARPEVDMSNPLAIFQLLNKKPVHSDKPKIAVVYAEGTIVDGHGGEGMLGGLSIGSEDIRRAMRLAIRDPQVKAVVIRIDSPGGSALASEAMWQSVRRVSAEKPVIISIGGMAASGGYYLASAGDTIVADPSAIVGSIGVVGGKFVMSDLYEKLGISTVEYKRGLNAGLFSSNEKFDDRQKRMVRTWMKNTYDQFTDRIKTTRGNKIKNIDEIARGRIFLASDAQALGMVDQMGGLTTALGVAAERAKLEKGEYDVTVLPAPMTFADMVSGGDGAEASLPFRPAMQINIKADSIVHMLPKNVRSSIGQQLQLMQILERRPVAVMAPFVMTTR